MAMLYCSVFARCTSGCNLAVTGGNLRCNLLLLS